METFFPTFHWTRLLIIPGLLIGYTIHELAHALVAYLLGDHSQVEERRLSLNPLEHVSWLGSLAFIMLGIGWPKTMWVNPANLQRRHRDIFLIALAGPIASMTVTLAGLLATLTLAALVVYGSGSSTDRVVAFLFPAGEAALPQSFNVQALAMAFTSYIISSSLALTFMSLLPLPGQDGFMIIASVIAFFREKNEVGPKSGRAPSEFRQKIMTTQQRRRSQAAEIHFQAGADYHEQEKFDDAIARYRQAIGNDVNFGPAYINMGLAYLAKNDRRKAIQSFRGATQHADDQRSQTEAWHQLQELSEVVPIDPEKTRVAMAEMGSTPWTDTKARPNWWALGLGLIFCLVIGLGVYAYLVIQLIGQLTA